MIASRRFALLRPVHTTNFIPVVTTETCNGCGRCAKACPVEAMEMVAGSGPQGSVEKKARLNRDICLGCGLCVRACRAGALGLESRPERVITPLNGAHRAVVMAIERGKLQNLIFDNQVLLSHRALAGVLGVILRLPPLRQALACRQVRSRYLEALIRFAQDRS
jgi:ferredoxin